MMSANNVSDDFERWDVPLKIAENQRPFSPDVEAVRDVIHRYCYFIDSQMSEKLRTIFTDDVELDYPTYHKRFKGIEEVLGIYKKQASKPYFPSTMAHRMSNEMVSISKGGDEAYVTSYYFGSVVQTTGELILFAGIYTFHMRKFNEIWKVIDYKIDRQWDGVVGKAEPRGLGHKLPYDGDLLTRT
jgi:hypothetical protein